MRYADIPPPLSAGLSPGRRTRKALYDSFSIFPCCKLVVDAGPLDQVLLDRALAALVESCLQDPFWDLQVVIDVR